ncbi:MAG: hydantoinase/oxoprolinase family protein [Betaproteobacteria bacterium]|nr:hydantoinase/oxoprolinase family protein [Betaproteobacteria bacterium]
MSIVAVDVGGTFTDLAAVDGGSGELRFSKSLSTPPEFERAALDCLAKAHIDPRSVKILRHGTTVVMNTLLERKGAKTALITTIGFRDVLEIGRGNRPEAFNLQYERLPSFVPRIHRYEVPERIDAHGKVLQALDRDALRAIAKKLVSEGIEAVAVCLFNSWCNPQHEIEIGTYLRAKTSCSVSCSYEISREIREHERTSTSVLNAYVAPKAASYVTRFDGALRKSGFKGQLYLMGSNGGVLTEEDTRLRPLLLVESGPVGGVAGTIEIGARTGLRKLIAFDMGGTTAKAALVEDGEASVSSLYWVAGYERGYPVQAAVLDIVEIGTGGGSIAGVNELGALEVGPRSASAVPGPACYARGGEEPTITDANLLLGRLDAKHFFGGAMPLRRDLAEAALGRLGDKLHQPVMALASGIVQIATLNMASAVRRVSIERGYDPRDFSMVAFGGAGPLHAVAVAQEIGMRQVIIPPNPGHFSAYGMLFADFRYDVTGTIACSLDEMDLARAQKLFTELEEEGSRQLAGIGIPFESLRYTRYAEMRYERQEYTIKVRLPAQCDDRKEWRRLFEESYRRRFGHSSSDVGVDVVVLRVVVDGRSARPQEKAKTEPGTGAIPPTQRPAWFEDTGMVACQVWQRRDLAVGRRIQGPAVIEEEASTTVLPAGNEAEIDAFGNIIITLGKSS